MPLLALCLALPASAEDDFSRAGCYLGAGGAWAVPTELEDEIEGVDGVRSGGSASNPTAVLVRSDADVDESLALYGRIGCRGRYLGVEGHFEWLDGFDVELRDTLGGRAKSTADGWMASGNLKLYPFAGRIQPFVNVGIGYLTFDVDAKLGSTNPFGSPPDFNDPDLDVDVDEWDFAARLGGGLELYLTRNVAISLDAIYVLPVSDELADFDYVSLGGGLLFRF